VSLRKALNGIASGVTDEGQGANAPPWQLRRGPLFINGPPIL